MVGYGRKRSVYRLDAGKEDGGSWEGESARFYDNFLVSRCFLR